MVEQAQSVKVQSLDGLSAAVAHTYEQVHRISPLVHPARGKYSMGHGG